MLSDLILLGFGFLVLAVGFCFGMLFANGKIHKYINQKAENPDNWCYENCKIHEKCFADHEDPDDAVKELEDYCSECPVCYAQMILYEERMGKR